MDKSSERCKIGINWEEAVPNICDTFTKIRGTNRATSMLFVYFIRVPTGRWRSVTLRGRLYFNRAFSVVFPTSLRRLLRLWTVVCWQHRDVSHPRRRCACESYKRILSHADLRRRSVCRWIYEVDYDERRRPSCIHRHDCCYYWNSQHNFTLSLRRPWNP